MTIPTFPDILPSRATWGLQANTEKFTSPLNGATQTVGRPGTRWKATLEFSGLSCAQGALLDAFLASLNGQAGRFYLYPHHRPGTKGTGVVVAASGASLTVSGITLATGDFVQAGDEFKIVIGSGTIAPPWRNAPAVDAPVIATEPKCKMMLSSDEYAVTRLPGDLYDNVTISCVEAF